MWGVPCGYDIKERTEKAFRGVQQGVQLLTGNRGHGKECWLSGWKIELGVWFIESGH